MFDKLKGCGKLVEKVVINQVGMTLFGTVLYIAASAMGQSNAETGKWMKIATSVGSIIFYLVLLYTVSRDEGLKDQVRIESGRIQYDKNKFLRISLAANSVNILLAVIISALMTVRLISGSISEIASNISFVIAMIIQFTQGMYYGVWHDVLSSNAYVTLFMALPAIIVCTLGYRIGTKGGFKNIVKSKKEKSE